MYVGVKRNEQQCTAKSSGG